MSQSGFSFVGLMLLTVLLALAGSIVMVTLDSTFTNQSLAETVKKMDRIVVAIGKYKTDNATSSNPPTLAYLFTDVGGVGCAANTASSKLQGWCGPYLDEVFQEDASDAITDGWNTTFEYNNAGFLYSWGPDKTDDNGGDDDLTRTF